VTGLEKAFVELSRSVDFYLEDGSDLNYASLEKAAKKARRVLADEAEMRDETRRVLSECLTIIDVEISANRKPRRKRKGNRTWPEILTDCRARIVALIGEPEG